MSYNMDIKWSQIIKNNKDDNIEGMIRLKRLKNILTKWMSLRSFACDSDYQVLILYGPTSSNFIAEAISVGESKSLKFDRGRVPTFCT